jgi:signal transduction histidine kinase/DNA-binding NarL/FixJ family response regulator
MSPQRAKRILLIEDDEVDRLAVRRTLAKTELRPTVIEASTCEAARGVLRDAGVDCVLLDVYLPDGDGLSLLRESRAAGIDTPTIVLTGQGDEALAVELMKAGAADYLPKSLLTPDALTQSIRRAFRIHDAERQVREAEERLRRQTNQLHHLALVGSEVHEADTGEEALQLSARFARELIGARLALAVWTGPAGPESLVAASDLDGLATSGGFTPTALFWNGIVRLENQSLRLGVDAIRARASVTGATDPRLDDWRGILAVPLINREGAAVGSLQLFDPLAAEFSTLDEDILLQLGRTSSVALENARLYHQAREATQARDIVLAVVSHDLRNPLALIKMNTSLLEKNLASSGADPSTVNHLKRIGRGVARMERMISDLLDAASIDSKALSVHPAPESVAGLVAEAAEMGQLLADTKGCSFVMRPVDPSLHVLADHQRILQVFANLIGNALKFIPADGGEIVLRAERRGDGVAFFVSDNGPGIPPEDVGRLFERFWRGRESSDGGIGLGLFIARGIVDAHGGSIAVEPGPGSGTTIGFQLSLAPEDRAVEAVGFADRPPRSDSPAPPVAR